ncbi:MAG: hypothetical protein ACP5TZ_04585 [Nitrososphaeria archaeon]
MKVIIIVPANQLRIGYFCILRDLLQSINLQNTNVLNSDVQFVNDFVGYAVLVKGYRIYVFLELYSANLYPFALLMLYTAAS